MLRAPAWPALILAVAACPPVQPPAPLPRAATHSDFVEALAKDACALGCRLDADECEAWARAAIREGFAPLGKPSFHSAWSVELGRASYDAVRGEDCLRSVEQACQGSLLACARVTVAAAPTGSRCHRFDDCMSKDDGCYGAGCARQCRVGGRVGEACRRQGPACDDALVCDRGVCRAVVAEGSSCEGTVLRHECGPNAVCFRMRCVRLPATGAACPLGVCDSASACVAGACVAKGGVDAGCLTVPCERGLRCAAGVCAGRQRDGEACQTADACEEGSLCLAGRCTPPVELGAACQSAGDCAEELECDELVGRCVYPTEEGSGAPCSSARRCVAPEVCRPAVDGAERRCGVSEEGDVCSAVVSCSPGFGCRDGRCVAAGEGSACSATSECRTEDVCVGSACRRRGVLGGPCVRAEGSCLEGVCAAEPGGSLVCQRLPGVGAACLEGACAGRAVCVAGRCAAAGRPGQPCSTFVVRCLGGECVSSDGGVAEGLEEPGVCSGLRTDGQACRTDQGCASGVCERGTGAMTGAWVGTCAAVCR